MSHVNDIKPFEGKHVGEQLNAMYEWELLGAEEKARSIIQLTDGCDIQSVFEIGSGTGALLETLDRLGFGERYYAVEPSKRLYDFVSGRRSISRLVTLEQRRLDECELAQGHYDLVVLSHVLEHIENPAELLSHAIKLARFILVELPMDGNACGNVRAAVKSTLTGHPRHNNYAGHIQFFSPKDVAQLVYWCGGEVLRSRLYASLAPMRKKSTGGSMMTRAYRKLILGIRHILGEQLFGRLYYGHYAVLVRKREPIADEERTLWPSSNYYL